MRCTTLRLLVSATALVLIAQGHAQAQVRNPASRPPVSPAINFFRNDNPTFLNYYGLVRPQADTYNNLQQIQQQVTTNRQAITQVEEGGVTSALPATGHSFGYNTHLSYFMNNGRRTTGTTTGARPATTPITAPTGASQRPQSYNPTQPRGSR
jgi:hypothetical protein